MQLPIFTVDAFTPTLFSGNPAAVVPLTQALDDATMQKVATEMNLSETAFVRPLEGGQDTPWTTCTRYSLRWFTPNQEIPLCGHATLATAHTLFHHLGHSGSRVQFETLSGVLEAGRDGDNVVMDFPNNMPEPLSDAEQQQLAQLVQETSCGLTMKDVLLSRTLKYLHLRLTNSYTRKDLEALAPKFQVMARVHDGSLVKAVMVSVAGDGQPYHACSRFFAPWYGVDEDPVTGSAHTALGPYWAEQLGRKDLNFRQCGKRGGDVKVTVRDDGRVDISGPSVTVLEGRITV